MMAEKLDDLPSKMIEGQPWVPLLPVQAIVATLRATAELAWLSLRDYTMAQSRMSDGWDRASESAKRQLLKDLHFCEAGGREAMQAIMDNKAHPTTNPTDSDGSGT